MPKPKDKRVKKHESSKLSEVIGTSQIRKTISSPLKEENANRHPLIFDGAYGWAPRYSSKQPYTSASPGADNTERERVIREVEHGFYLPEKPRKGSSDNDNKKKKIIKKKTSHYRDSTISSRNKVNSDIKKNNEPSKNRPWR